MSPELRRLVETTLILTPELEDRSQVIFETVLNSSPYIDQPNFTALCDDDLSHLFAQYDQRFFGGACQRTLHAMGSPLDFRVSPRMTRAGGKTTRMVPRVARGLSPVPRFEIAVSSTLLFQTFADVDRPIKVTGLMCFNRLEALLRIFEHELIHLVEMLLWQASCCAAPRFRGIAGRFFGHTESTHQLITPDERAREKFGIRPGDRVTRRPARPALLRRPALRQVLRPGGNARTLGVTWRCRIQTGEPGGVSPRTNRITLVRGLTAPGSPNTRAKNTQASDQDSEQPLAAFDHTGHTVCYESWR